MGDDSGGGAQPVHVNACARIADNVLQARAASITFEFRLAEGGGEMVVTKWGSNNLKA